MPRFVGEDTPQTLTNKEIDGDNNTLVDAAPASHTHVEADITDLDTGGGGGGAAVPVVPITYVQSPMIPIATGSGVSVGGSSTVAFAITEGVKLTCSNGDYACGFLTAYYNSFWGGAWMEELYSRTWYGAWEVGINLTQSSSELYIGNGGSSSAYTGGYDTSKPMIGFRIVRSGGSYSIKAIVGNGSTTTETDITTAADATAGFTIYDQNRTMLFLIEYTPTAVKFYINGTLMTTITTTIPTSDSNAGPLLNHYLYSAGGGTNLGCSVRHSALYVNGY